jgi:hypothetical protein
MRFVADQATEKVTQITANKTTGVMAGKDIITLQATVMDEYDHPIDNAVVHWGTDNDTGVFAACRQQYDKQRRCCRNIVYGDKSASHVGRRRD